MLKLSHHDHSGRVRAHEYTSYLPLALLLGLVGLALTSFTVSAANSPGPEAGSIGISGTMPGTPPTVAATIDSPARNQRFSTTPVTISGTCPADTLVEIRKNDIFAGSTICSSAGVYSFDIDLLIGVNELVARVYDSLNQPGPESNSVTVFYDALPPQATPLNSLDFGDAQLLLNTDTVFRGTFPNQELKLPLEVLGGTVPYAVNVQWGDSDNNVFPRDSNVSFNASHVYTRPGTYQISIQASDSNDRVAFLTVAAIINGTPQTVSSTGDSSADGITLGRLLALWPFYVSAVAIVISFWLGEVREKRILKKHQLA